MKIINIRQKGDKQYSVFIMREILYKKREKVLIKCCFSLKLFGFSTISPAQLKHVD